MTTKSVTRKAVGSAEPVERADGYEARRLRILREAALAFAEQGYHETSVSDLAARLNVTKPVLYYYAKNKDDLLFQCGQIAFAELQEAMRHASAAKLSGAGKLRNFFTAYTAVMCGDFGRCLALVDVKSTEATTRNANLKARRDLEDAVRAMICEGQADSSVRKCDPVLAARALFGSFNGIPRWFRPDQALSSSDIADMYLDLFMEGLGGR